MKHAKDLFSTTLVFVIGDRILEKSKICSNNPTYFPNSVCFDPAGGEGSRSVLTTQKGLASGDIDIGMLFLSTTSFRKRINSPSLACYRGMFILQPESLDLFPVMRKSPQPPRSFCNTSFPPTPKRSSKKQVSSNTGNARAIALPAAAWAAPA